jgi:hypothetical protein
MEIPSGLMPPPLPARWEFQAVSETHAPPAPVVVKWVAPTAVI